MKTRLIQIATLLMLLAGGTASAAEVPATPAPQAVSPAVQPTVQERVAWQRVGAPDTGLG